MFASITTFAKRVFAKNVVTKYKAQRVKDVVTQYFAAVDTQATTVLPVAIEFYRNSAHVIVDKTFENPEPARKLIEALNAVSSHYVPALKAEFKAFSANLEERGADSAMLQRVEALSKAIEALTTDLNDH